MKGRPMVRKSELVGTILVPAGEYTDRSFECAAWHVTVRVEEQRVPVYLIRTSLWQPESFFWKAVGVVTDAHLASYFCGNRIGDDDPAGKAAVGTPRDHGFRAPATHKRIARMLDEQGFELALGYEWIAQPETWDRLWADHHLTVAIKYHETWQDIDRRVNGEQLRALGTPALVAQIRN
jgi:hypothetical protein